MCLKQWHVFLLHPTADTSKMACHHVAHTGTHHHKHPQPPTDHDNHLTTMLNDHTPTSPASTTMSCLLPHHATPTTSNNLGCPKYFNCPIDHHAQKRPRVANDGQRPTSNIDCPATMKTANNSCQTTSMHE